MSEPDDRRFGALPRHDMTPEQDAVAEAILSGPRGASTGIRGPFEALLHSPELAHAVQQTGAYLRFESSIPTALNEMAIILTARRWTAQFEWQVHRRFALDAGLDEAVADAIARDERPELDADATAVYDFASQLLEDGAVTDDVWAAVESRWGKRGTIDLVGVVGYYTLVSFILNVDRYPPLDDEPRLDPR